MRSESSAVMIFITCANEEEAAIIAEILLGQKMIACANIIPAVYSRYRWKGEIENKTESMLVIKTGAALLEDIIDRVKNVHSYEVPEILALPVIGGSPDYLAWIESETGQDREEYT